MWQRPRRSAANSPRPPQPLPPRRRARRRLNKQSARAVASRATHGCTVQAPAWEALRVLRTIDPQHATAVALEAGGAAKV